MHGAVEDEKSTRSPTPVDSRKLVQEQPSNVRKEKKKKRRKNAYI